MEARVVVLGYDLLSYLDIGSFNLTGELMSDLHQQLLDKITDIKSDSQCHPCYQGDTDIYQRNLDDVSNMLEDEIQKLKSRIA
jgi:ribosomal protein L31